MTAGEAWAVEGFGADAAEACRLLNASLTPPGPFDPAEEAARPQGRVWVARRAEGGPVRGFLVAWRVADELEVLFVATGPAFRRQGVGRALLRRAVEEAQAEGLARLLLEVARGNLAARALYEGFGFRETGVRRGYYDDGDDAVLMGLDIAPGPA